MLDIMISTTVRAHIHSFKGKYILFALIDANKAVFVESLNDAVWRARYVFNRKYHCLTM